MGQHHSSPYLTAFTNRSQPSFTAFAHLPCMKFHSSHGDNIELLNEATEARRFDSFCKGIVFSHRRVCFGEPICFRLKDLSSRWTGVIRIGFTSNDPANQASLPKYACPDLTSRPGYWAKAISQKYASDTDTLIHYYVTSSGDVYFGVNGRNCGLFFKGVDTRQPLWAMIDLYGNCTSIELVHGANSSRETRQNNVSNNNVTLAPAVVTVRLPPEVPQNTLVDLERQRSCSQSSSLFPTLRFNDANSLCNISLHTKTGKNAIMDRTTNVVWRKEDEFGQGYVMTALPVKFGEIIIVQVLATEESFVGSLAFGLTSCDPQTLDLSLFPEDSELLQNRGNSWTVVKDVAESPCYGDELSFRLSSSDGIISIAKNDQMFSKIMQVNPLSRLWAFWDVYGHTSMIRIVGTKKEMSPPNILLNDPCSDMPLPKIGVTECTVCYERPVDCVIYTCGHMCMCYSCGIQQWKGRPNVTGSGICPICRTEIRDIIKTFQV